MHLYNKKFFDYISDGSTDSAKKIVPILQDYLEFNSVLDVGCGLGAWLAIYKEFGKIVTGIDGPYVDKEQLLIGRDEFVSADLSAGFDLGRKFDLVQSLEVAEHIPTKYADTFIDSLIAHGDCILFSAAVPGQGGENHVNEQPLEYWRNKFSSRGYLPFDLVRQNLDLKDRSVMPWYRFNTVLYINQDSLVRTSPRLQPSAIPLGDKIPNYTDFRWSLRKTLVRFMPVSVATKIAQLKKIWA
jgi:SAM-dependent methyltransferase